MVRVGGEPLLSAILCVCAWRFPQLARLSGMHSLLS